MNSILKYVILFNLGALVISLVGLTVGYNFLSSFPIMLMVISAFLLLIGGGTGFLVSSFSFKDFKKVFQFEPKRRQAENQKRSDDNNEVEMKKEEEKLRKEDLRLGRMMIFVGSILLIESIIVALIF